MSYSSFNMTNVWLNAAVNTVVLAVLNALVGGIGSMIASSKEEKNQWNSLIKDTRVSFPW